MVAGWLAFTGRELNPLDRYKRFQIILSSPFSGFILAQCKYHVVFTPKYRKKLLFGQIRRHLGTVFHELAKRKECKIEEGHLMPDHVHMLISIPPKYSVAEVIGYLKGKSSIWIAQNVERKLRNFLGHKFWARGYFVSTVGRDEEAIRTYIKNQEIAACAKAH